MAYMYLPESKSKIMEGSPVRDLGTAHVLGSLQAWTGTTDMDAAILATLHHYEAIIVREDSHEAEGPVTAEGLGATETEPELAAAPIPWACLDPGGLKERSNIAHNAMMILALAAFERYPDENRKESLLGDLARGLCHQQRPKDGRFRVHFPPFTAKNGDSGWELYSGEAELALAVAYGRLADGRFLHAGLKAFAAYRRAYEAEKVRPGSLIFFANWQCQAGEALLKYVTDDCKARHILETMLQLQDAVVFTEKFFERIADQPEEASVVQVACGLEGLAATHSAAMRLGEESHQQRAAAWEPTIITAVNFLLAVQSGSSGEDDEDAQGGFGFTMGDSRQRIDVTGHVCAGFMHLLLETQP